MERVVLQKYKEFPKFCFASYLVFSVSEVDLKVKKCVHFKEKRKTEAFEVRMWRHKWMGRGKAYHRRKGGEEREACRTPGKIKIAPKKLCQKAA